MPNLAGTAEAIRYMDYVYVVPKDQPFDPSNTTQKPRIVIPNQNPDTGEITSWRAARTTDDLTLRGIRDDTGKQFTSLAEARAWCSTEEGINGYGGEERYLWYIDLATERYTDRDAYAMKSIANDWPIYDRTITTLEAAYQKCLDNLTSWDEPINLDDCKNIVDQAYLWAKDPAVSALSVIGNWFGGTAFTNLNEALTACDTRWQDTWMGSADECRDRVGQTYNNYTRELNYDLSPFPDGTYDLYFTASTIDNQIYNPIFRSSLIIDTIAPTVTIITQNTTDTVSPSLTGTVDDPNATVKITLAGRTYIAINNGNGTWTIPAGIIQGPTTGTYEIIIEVTDQAGNTAIEAKTVVLTITSTGDPKSNPQDGLAATGVSMYIAAGLVAGLSIFGAAMIYRLRRAS